MITQEIIKTNNTHIFDHSVIYFTVNFTVSRHTDEVASEGREDEGINAGYILFRSLRSFYFSQYNKENSVSTSR